MSESLNDLFGMPPGEVVLCMAGEKGFEPLNPKFVASGAIHRLSYTTKPQLPFGRPGLQSVSL
jgi:hypothetical protein